LLAISSQELSLIHFVSALRPMELIRHYQPLAQIGIKVGVKTGHFPIFPAQSIF
jgi:hypothetical protein